MSNDSRSDRLDGGSMVRWDREPSLDFADETDGFVVLQELGDELRAAREQQRHIMRYLKAAVQAVRLQHQAQPQAIIRESGVARQTIYTMLEEIVDQVADNDDPTVSADAAQWSPGDREQAAETLMNDPVEASPKGREDIAEPICQHGTGPFTNVGVAGAERWVHADPACRRPTQGWLTAQRSEPKP